MFPIGGGPDQFPCVYLRFQGEELHVLWSEGFPEL